MHLGLVGKRGFNLSVAARRSFLFIISTPPPQPHSITLAVLALSCPVLLRLLYLSYVKYSHYPYYPYAPELGHYTTPVAWHVEAPWSTTASRT